MPTTTRCARCGREIEAHSYLCDQCREEEGPSLGTRIRPPSDLEARADRWPGWIPKPSPVQYHATIMVTILLVLAGLALFAFLNHRGVGPFPAHVDTWSFRAPSSIVVEATVTNGGTRAARANCRVTEFQGTYAGVGSSVLTDLIPPKKTLNFREVITGVPAAPPGTNVRVTCN
jgi:hypothetical protein